MEDIFRDGGAFFNRQTPIYSFDRKNVMTDNTWPSKYVWHGSETRGKRKSGKFCDAWRSSSAKKSGMASSLENFSLLGQQDFPCNNSFIVLCIENMSKGNVERRLAKKRFGPVLKDDATDMSAFASSSDYWKHQHRLLEELF
ncbi:Endostatin domain containing protein [Trichuris trichiura]|uniref:Endostatin domain containing protein n=1 Tax=Trichuris trichiura TaxID=36087 RepID=A0A077Z4M2_TRITR|nr:Endostatin domain containing protein [Trichuris trichiura]